MDGHHLILGEIADFVTGETLRDTHDERYRQSIARLLVEQKGYLKKDIRPRWDLRVTAGEKCALVKIDFSIVMNDRVYMMIRYAPGSLVTRHRPSLAASRQGMNYWKGCENPILLKFQSKELKKSRELFLRLKWTAAALVMIRFAA
jgi:hypothetical protein